MYARRAGEKELTFDFADGLLDNNLLVVDRETNSVWSQLHGKAVIGELEGTPLEIIPSMQTTWKFWRERHPDTRVMVLSETEGRPYLYRNRPTGTPSSEVGPQTEHDATALGLGIVLGGRGALGVVSRPGRTRGPRRDDAGRPEHPHLL